MCNAFYKHAYGAMQFKWLSKAGAYTNTFNILHVQIQIKQLNSNTRLYSISYIIMSTYHLTHSISGDFHVKLRQKWPGKEVEAGSLQ